MYIDEILNFYRESYRSTGNKHYLDCLKHWNRIKYENQKQTGLVIDAIMFALKDIIGIVSKEATVESLMFSLYENLNRDKDE